MKRKCGCVRGAARKSPNPLYPIAYLLFFFSYHTKYPVSLFCISKMCGLSWLIDKNNFHNDKTFDDTQSYVTLKWNVCLNSQVSLWIQC